MLVRRLIDFPYILVRLRCDACKRAGAYRLARLAVKFGSEILLDDLLLSLSADCPWRDDPRGTCGVRFVDLPLLKDYLQQMVKMSPLQSYSLEIVEDDPKVRIIGAAVTAEQAAGL